MPTLILVVATFHSLGLSWSPPGGGASVECSVRYHAAGESEWHDAMPLWYDARDDEYRGSLVTLTPGTAYTVELSLEGGATTTTEASTWSETFPIARRVTIADSTEPLVIDEGGTAEGYVLYEGGTIDISDDSSHPAILVNASYVIVRGVTTIGGDDGIRVSGAHDVVIEESDVSGWGRRHADGFGEDEWAAVRCRRDLSVERVVVQRNRLHHPRSDTNSWGEYRDFAGTSHPIGPMGTHFDTCGGNHVFRYNELFSDGDHYMADGIGGADNFTDAGFPRADSDIYGNHISECWDDAIESEGANRNVRIWGNLLENTYVGIGVATTSVGPLYVFRNVMGASRYDDSVPRDEDDHGTFLKVGGREPDYGGRMYVFHNTTLQPEDPTGEASLGIGAGGGITDSGAPLVEQIVSRNNVFFLHKDWWDAIHDGRRSPTNDFDYDLYNGGISAYSGAEAHGIEGEPIFMADGLSLDPSSPGHDSGAVLAGFNDGFLGSAPDDGAQETGAPPLEFGVDAYLTTEPTPGRDAGVGPGPDAGVGPGVDGGVPPGSDGSIPRADGASDRDAGSARPQMTSGCSVGRSRSTSTVTWLVTALAMFTVARRRRAR